MAQRILRQNEDKILRKKSKEIKKITPRIKQIANDMVDTLKVAEGVGLSAVQVGILKRLVVVDFEDDETFGELFQDGPIIAINPIITSEEGSVIEKEACLSFPQTFGQVERPEKVTVTYTDLDGNEHEEEYEGMVARCFCHELDHLDGIVYLDRVIEGTLNQSDPEEDEEA